MATLSFEEHLSEYEGAALDTDWASLFEDDASLLFGDASDAPLDVSRHVSSEFAFLRRQMRQFSGAIKRSLVQQQQSGRAVLEAVKGALGQAGINPTLAELKALMKVRATAAMGLTTSSAPAACQPLLRMHHHDKASASLLDLR